MFVRTQGQGIHCNGVVRRAVVVWTHESKVCAPRFGGFEYVFDEV
jgi:hypothetical protein